MFLETNEDLTKLLQRCASDDRNDAMQAQAEFAQAVEAAYRGAVLVGDIATYLFTQYKLNPGQDFLEFPLDILAPGEEDEYNAYVQPGTGTIPQRHIEGDYVRFPTYRLASSIDWDIKFSENANYPVMERIMEIFHAGFIKKINDDLFSVLISAAADRNILIYDADANAGQFTKRAVSLAQVAMRRNGGGNSASQKRSRLTDIMGSPELLEDIRNWGIDQLDEISRREVYIADDGADVLTRVFGVNIHDLDEFGEDQVYQTFYTDVLGASLIGSDTEFALGLDLGNKRDFVMPIKQEMRVYNEDYFRQQRQGVFGTYALGAGTTDSRRCIGISF